MNAHGRFPAARGLGPLALAALLLALGSSAVPAQVRIQPPVQSQIADFSFYGVKFGMTRAEIGQVWLPLSGGTYAVSSPAIKQIKPSFDHEGRLYEFSFAVELSFPDEPATLVSLAFQEALNEKWKRFSGLIVNLSSGPSGSQVTLVDERLRNGYVKHLQGKMAAILQP